MTNEANIDIQVDDNDVSALVSTLASLKEVLESNARAMSRLESSAENLEGDIKDVEQAADGARRAVDALGIAAAGAAAAFAVVGAGVEGLKVSIEAFAETNAEAGARMEALSTSAQTLLGNFGRVALGGDNFAQTLEVLTRMFELLNDYVGQNSDALSRMATSVLRVLIQAFFGLIDVGFEVIRFVTRLDLSLFALEAGFLRAKAAVLEFASDSLEGIGDFAADAIESFADFLDALDDVQTTIIDNPVGRALFGIEEGSITGPVGALAEGMRSVADSIRNSTSDTFADNIERARDRAEELNNIIESTPDPTVELQAGMREVRDQTLRWIDDLENVVPRELDVNLNVVGGAGGGGSFRSGSQVPTITAQQARELVFAEGRALLRSITSSALQLSKEAFEYLEESVGIYTVRAGDSIKSMSDALGTTQEEIVQQLEALYNRPVPYVGDQITAPAVATLIDAITQSLRNEIASTTDKIRSAIEGLTEEEAEPILSAWAESLSTRLIDLRDQFTKRINKSLVNSARLEAANVDPEFSQELQEQSNFVNRNVELLKEYSTEIGNASAAWDIVLSTARALGVEEDRILQIEQRRDENYASINERFRQQIDDAEAAREALKAPTPFTIDTSVLTTGIGRRADRDRRSRLQEIGATQFSSEAEALKALTSALTDQELAWARANGGVKAYLDTVARLKEETREAFKADAIDAFENTFVTLGSTIGTALGGGFDDSITGAERAKAVLFELLGSTLTALGSTAIAQGAIYAFGDPRVGGFANPVGAAGLIAAGTAAVAVGSAFSARAGAIQSSAGAGAPGVTPATTPGGGGASESTTNVFIENRFGNRFDAREVDRAAAESFAAAAAAGQA